MDAEEKTIVMDIQGVSVEGKAVPFFPEEVAMAIMDVSVPVGRDYFDDKLSNSTIYASLAIRDEARLSHSYSETEKTIAAKWSENSSPGFYEGMAVMASEMVMASGRASKAVPDMAQIFAAFGQLGSAFLVMACKRIKENRQRGPITQ